MSWNGSAGANAPKKIESNAPSKMRGLVALALVVVVGGGVAAWWFTRPVVRPVKQQQHVERKISEVTPQKRQSASELLAEVKSGKVRAVAPQPAVSNEEIVTVKTLSELRPDIDWSTLTNRTFSTGTEQLLSWICHATPGEMMLPLPPIPDEDKRNIAAILISKNEVNDTDSERVAKAKTDVDFAKKELAKFIKDGGTPEEFFDYYNKAIKEAYQTRKGYVEELQAMQVDEENPVDAETMKTLVDRVNEKLEAEGIKPVVFDEEGNSVS